MLSMIIQVSEVDLNKNHQTQSWHDHAMMTAKACLVLWSWSETRMIDSKSKIGLHLKSLFWYLVKGFSLDGM